MVSSPKMNSEILSNRLLKFSKDCQELVTKLPKAQYNIIYGSQLIRSSSSPGANYIEAIEAFSKKEFILRLKICRKEAKESVYWLTLIQNSNRKVSWVALRCQILINEGKELVKIFTASIITSEKNKAIEKIRK